MAALSSVYTININVSDFRHMTDMCSLSLFLCLFVIGIQTAAEDQSLVVLLSLSPKNRESFYPGET